MGTYRGLKIAKTTTNYYKLSRKSVNQTVAVTVGTKYTVSVRGKAGSIALSGAAVGTVTESTPLTFTATTTSLVVTVTGHLKHIQVELGSIASQEVWTRNASLTRPADAPSAIAGLQAGGKLGATSGAIIIDLSRAVSNNAATAFLSLVKTGSTVTGDAIRLLSDQAVTGQLRVRVYVNSVLTNRDYNTFNLLQGGKVGLSWSATQLKVFHNGVLVETLNQAIPSGLDSMLFHGENNDIIYKGIFLFNQRPEDADMIASTNY